MSKFQNNIIGQIGEHLAKQFLLDHGYQIIDQNFRTKFGEIDIIAKHHHTLVFVEVKTKQSTYFGSPEEMFTPGKYQRVKRMATTYLKGEDTPCRIDMIAILINHNHQLTSLHHYQNPF